jgi:hypothetical protein
MESQRPVGKRKISLLPDKDYYFILYHHVKKGMQGGNKNKRTKLIGN